MMNSDFFDPDFRLFMIKDYEDIRYRRKQLKGRPSPEEKAIINLEREFETFYRRFI